MPALRKNITALHFPPFSDGIPKQHVVQGEYSLQFADTSAELAAIQRLRYRVFNVELAEGLDSSHKSEMDIDEFDSVCHHLFVRHTKSNQIIGTYRMQTRSMAAVNLGFYSETEFDLSDFPEADLDQSIEIGRACIAADHRSLSVLYLLWKGLGMYASHNEMRYLFGCCSLTSQDGRDGANLYAFLEQKGHLHPTLNSVPLPDNRCCDEDADPQARVRPPRLMRAYLSLGAKICGRPAIDREFKTIDFLALFDFEVLRSSDLAFYRFLS